MINGFTEINLTKLDVLSDFDEIQIGVEYVHSGKPLGTMPASLKTFSEVEVKYETVPGWKSDISKATCFSDLPPTCQAYVLRLEELIGVPIRWIGVGAGREAQIDRFK